MTYFNAQGQGRVGWRSLVVTQVVNAVDADAQAFISAAGITNLTQASAVNTLVNDLKTYGLWTKMKALYPMVGGTATSHKFNLKDPRDLDAAFRLTFSGGWTHTSTGALPNGTTGYADTKLGANLLQTNNHLSYYSRTSTVNVQIEVGAYDNLPAGIICQLRTAGNYISGTVASAANFTTISSALGFWLGTKRSNTDREVYLNGNSQSSVTANASELLPSINMYLGARNKGGTSAELYSTKESAFASIGDGLTDTEAANFYNSVQKFQTTLGRQIGSPIVSDTDAQAFINAAGLTDLGQANAVNTLVVDLKAAGVWTKMKALYPFVGGTATTHKWNLKDPRDLDAAFRLVFNGGMTHTSLGMVSNYTTSYADTRLTPSTALSSLFSQHVSVYSQTSTASPTNNTNSIGEYQDGTRSMLMKIRNLSNVFSWEVGNGGASVSNTDGKGFYLGSVVANNSVKLYKNNTNVATNTATFTGSLPTQMQPIGKNENKTFSFASIGDGLTDADATAFYTAVQKYQTTLGRQIGTPVLAEGQTAGLLETYSGAAAAYSLRKLRTGYYGNAIRVRRSSDNAEQDIAFDASGNLDTTSLLAFVGSGNGFVTTWYDQSGFNNHITQTTAGNQPQIVSSGVVKLLNNKPSIYFDGSSTYFNSSTQTVLSTGGGGYSIFGTAKPSGTSGSKCLFYIGSATGNNGVGFNLSNTQPRHYWFGNDYDTSQTFSDTNAIYAVSYDGSKRYTAINNVTQSQNATGKNTISPILMVGKLQGYGQTFIGLQSELIIYNSYKDTSITNIYGSMNSYYSIY